MRDFLPAFPDPTVVRARAILLKAVRHFFDDCGFVEAPTPILVSPPALEDYIDAVPAGDSGWLRTSAELHLKRLVQAGLPRVYQTDSCFRAGEHGCRHRVEFSMLEWYAAGVGYRELIVMVRDLLLAVAEAVAGRTTFCFVGSTVNLAAEWTVLRVDEAFSRYAGKAVTASIAAGSFEQDLVEKVEPHLGCGAPCVLIDYPAELGALARQKPGEPGWVERWELYVGGMELANAYGELVDAAEQRRRFVATAQLREREGREVYPLDTAFLAAMEAGMPAMSGCALGLDRLLMLLLETEDIAQVRAFD